MNIRKRKCFHKEKVEHPHTNKYTMFQETVKLDQVEIVFENFRNLTRWKHACHETLNLPVNQLIILS